MFPSTNKENTAMAQANRDRGMGSAFYDPNEKMTFEVSTTTTGD